MRLPRRITLPFGYVVSVRLVTDAEMKAEADGEVTDGLWDDETRTILVRRDLPMKRRKYVLGHELGHAYLDWTHFCFDEEAMKP